MAKFRVLFLFCFCMSLPCAALAAPKNVRLSFPVTNAARGIGIAWETDAETPTAVEYGTDAQSLTLMEVGSVFLGKGSLGYVHEVTLTNLSPSTKYFYRAGSAGDWSPVYSFTSAPPDSRYCASFKFVALGDERAQSDNVGASEKWAPILEESMTSGPAFVLNTGDIVKNGDVETEWHGWLDATDFANPLLPQAPALGNHDNDDAEGDAAYYNQIFFLPRNDVSDTEDFYWFTFGNAIFVTLSTVTFKGGGVPFGTQADWLDRVLAENPKPWKFVQFHHPIYTSADNIPLIGDLFHPANEEEQNGALVPVFDRHHVDFVLTGHNHYYERYAPMAGGNGDEGAPASGYDTGTVYVITGGAGAITFPEFAVGLICGNSKDTGSEACSGKHHYIVFSIENDKLRMETWATSAQNIGSDPANHQLMDSIEITKADPAFSDCRTQADLDEDGYPAGEDCDDSDPTVHPGAEELCGNDRDEDCSGADLPCPPVDADSDGYSSPQDCNDSDPSVHPGATEVCGNGKDEDCNGADLSCPPARDAGGDEKDAGGAAADEESPSDKDAGSKESDAAPATGKDAGRPGGKTAGEASGCGCASGPPRPAFLFAFLLVALALRLRLIKNA